MYIIHNVVQFLAGRHLHLSDQITVIAKYKTQHTH